METWVNERGSKEHLIEVFDYMDTKCPEFYADHHHVFNVDPRYLLHALSSLKFLRILKWQGKCMNLKCEWKENTYIHFETKNDQRKDR